MLLCEQTVGYLGFLVYLFIFTTARVFHVIQDEDYDNYTGEQFLDDDYFLWSEFPVFADVLKVEFCLFHPYFKFDNFTSCTLVYDSEDTDTLEDLHRSWTAIQTQIEVGKDFNMCRFLV